MEGGTREGRGGRRRVGFGPVDVGTIGDLHLEVVIGTLRVAVGERVVGSSVDVGGESAVGDTGHTDLPSTDDLVEDKRHTGTELPAAANRKVVNHVPIDCIAHVPSYGAVLRMEVVDVFGGRTGRVDAGDAVEAGAVGHAVAPGVVGGVLQTVPETLPEGGLQCVVVHHGVGVRVADDAVVAHTWSCIERCGGEGQTSVRRFRCCHDLNHATDDAGIVE